MSILKAGRPTRKEKAIEAVQNTKEELVKVNFNVAKSFYKDIKQRALDDDTNMTQLITRALQEYLSKKANK